MGWLDRINVKTSEKMTVHSFMEDCDFLWKPLALPCYCNVDGRYIEVEKHRVFARSDDLKPMYVVKKQFKLLSNEECFKICDNFKIKYTESRFVSCGDILKQRKSYITMILKKIKLADCDFMVYLTITNGFDGRNAVNCIVTLVKNDDFSVFQMFDESNPRIWTMGRVNSMITFDELCEQIESYIRYAEKVSNKMALIKIDLNSVINPLFDIDRKKSKCVNLHLAEEKEYIREIYLKNKGSTLFDLYMAMSHYYCHYKSKFEKLSNADIRFDFAMCGYFYKLQDYGNYLKNIFYKFS